MVKLICFDMDGVIFQSNNFWLDLHREFGTFEEGKILTKKYLHSNYNKLVDEVVGRLWKGKDAAIYFKLVKSISYNPGAKELFAFIKKKGWLIALISSGSIELARRAQHDLGIDFIYANELMVKDGKISGEFLWPIAAGKHKKAEIITHLCKDLKIDVSEVVYIGDDITDLEAFEIVGEAIAFNTKDEEPKKAAKYVVEKVDLREILKLL